MTTEQSADGLSTFGKFWRNIVSPKAPLSDEVWLQIVEDTKSGAVLSSDYAECRVNERKFRRLGGFYASMLKNDAAQCGLEDGWS